MLNNHTNKVTVTVSRTISGEVDKYVYRGNAVMRDRNLMAEIKRRSTLRRAPFGEVESIMRSRKQAWRSTGSFWMSIWLMTCGGETWAGWLTDVLMDTLSAADKELERIMLGITLHYRKHNT